MIMYYIKFEESIILNVFLVEVDFFICEFIWLFQIVDKKGVCMLVVVMKVDKVLEGLFEKVILDVVSIGFGYVCVCNCIFVDDSIVVVRC